MSTGREDQSLGRCSLLGAEPRTCGEGPGPGRSSATSHCVSLGKRPNSSGPPSPSVKRGPSPRHAAAKLFPGWSVPRPLAHSSSRRQPRACFRFPCHLLGSAEEKGSVSGPPPSLHTTLCPPGPTAGRAAPLRSGPLPPLLFISALFSQPSHPLAAPGPLPGPGNTKGNKPGTHSPGGKSVHSQALSFILKMF